MRVPSGLHRLPQPGASKLIFAEARPWLCIASIAAGVRGRVELEPGLERPRAIVVMPHMVREIESLDDIEPGYVLNLFGGPTGRVGNVIHPTNCPHLQQMTVPPRKLWARSVQELASWIMEQGGELDPTTPTCRYVL